MDPCRRGHTVLQRALPSKEEFVLLVRMSPIQRTLYSKFMVSMTETGLQNWASNNPLKAFSVCCKVMPASQGSVIYLLFIIFLFLSPIDMEPSRCSA